MVAGYPSIPPLIMIIVIHLYMKELLDYNQGVNYPDVASNLIVQLNWTRDFVSILRENAIGQAAWSYKGMDFNLVDLTGRVVSTELIKIVCSH